MKNIHNAGGNYFHDMRINIDAAFDLLPENGKKKDAKRNLAVFNKIKIWTDALLIKFNRMEAMVITGRRRDWFNEFKSFWSEALGGRPLNIMDFHMLRMWYRMKNQAVEQLSWNTIEEHLDNWKKDENMSMIFQQLYGNAISQHRPLPYVHKNSRVLEYGCSHAPYYRSYRKYYNHKKAKWVLADIKNISYLFSMYTYRNDCDIERMIVIDEKNADNPLADIEGKFDVIILTTVLEHLHKPKEIVEVLLSHLSRGGVFVFDYVKSEAIGLDSRQGLEQRLETLKWIKENTILVKGNLDNIDESVSLCISRKK